MVEVLITGAASGLGNGFAKAFASDESVSNIFLLDKAFPSTYSRSSKFVTVEVDLTNDAQLSTCCNDIRKSLQSRNASLDIVIHSAGIRGLEPTVPIAAYEDVAKAETLNITRPATMMRTLEVNAVGTFSFLRAIEPFLSKSDEESKARVMIMSSRMGSIGHNTIGGAYAYRASKAALNAIVRSIAVDIPQVIWTLVHPGRVETGLVSVREDGAMTAEESVRDMLSLLNTLNQTHSGGFVDRFGNSIEW